MIARRAGISQPYLFRLFGSKKELFLAVNDMCFQRTLDMFRSAAAGKSGPDALDAIGAAYVELIEGDPTMLQGQLQAYVAVGRRRGRSARAPRAGTGGSWTTSRPSRAPTAPRSRRFFAKGMLLNVLAAMEYSLEDEPPGLLGGASGRGVQGGLTWTAPLFFLHAVSNQSLDS